MLLPVCARGAAVRRSPPSPARPLPGVPALRALPAMQEKTSGLSTQEHTRKDDAEDEVRVSRHDTAGQMSDATIAEYADEGDVHVCPSSSWHSSRDDTPSPCMTRSSA